MEDFREGNGATALVLVVGHKHLAVLVLNVVVAEEVSGHREER